VEYHAAGHPPSLLRSGDVEANPGPTRAEFDAQFRKYYATLYADADLSPLNDALEWQMQYHQERAHYIHKMNLLIFRKIAPEMQSAFANLADGCDNIYLRRVIMAL
jgi:hypothetical protein